MLYLDTHVVAWLYAGATDRFSSTAQQLIEQNELLISPMVALELQYLFEIQRTSQGSAVVVSALGQELGLETCDLSFETVIQRALGESWTRDPFDRVIVGQAALRSAPLLTKDTFIHEHYDKAVW